MRNLLQKSAAIFVFCALQGAHGAEQIPFVGCAGDGHQGSVAAPTGAPKAVDIDVAAAGELAYYQAQDSFGVLAPRGWKCFFVYGSDGASLRIAPGGDSRDSSGAGLAGPAVVATLSSGQTSGRFAVAKYSARLFPKSQQKFIAGVIAEGIEPKANFPFGPFPADKLNYKSATTVEFETPAGKNGIGTSDRLRKSALPIRGVAALRESGSPDIPDFYLLTIRLPANQAELAKSIIAAAE